MNILVTIRNKQISWTRRALGLLAVAWLSIALQGCSMAEAAEHDCPACPPEHAQPEMPCDVEPAPCAYLDGRDFDSRTSQVKIEDAQGDMPVLLVTTLSDFSPAASKVKIPIPGTSLYPGVPPPLNLLHCVFLK